MSDLISRRAAIDALTKTSGIRGDALKALYELPPVTPHQKTGHWINGDDKCPCCGKSKFEDLDADIWADWQPKFCPNCGAKMVEPQESEDKE